MVNANVSTLVLSAITGLSLAYAVSVSTRLEPAAAAQGRPASALTAEDHVEIRNLVAKYSRAIDTCSNNGYDYADLYTPDGTFNSTRSGVPGTPYQGRDRLAEAAGGGSRGCRKLAREGGLWIHAIVNLVIEPSADGGAVGTSDLVYPSLRGKDFDAEHSGHVGGYEYVFARTAGGWRFRSVVHAM